MSKEHKVQSYDYVNQSYEQVRDILSKKPLEVFRDATKGAASRARSLASELRVNIGGIEVSTDISVSVKGISEVPQKGLSRPATRLQLEWEAAKRPRLFPLMSAELSIYPLTATETQLDFSGSYYPPLGPLGDAIDAAVGRRIFIQYARDSAEPQI